MAETDLAAELAAEAIAAAFPEGKEAAERPTLESMQALAEEVIDIDERIEKNEARIRELRARRDTILTASLVDMMDEAGVSLLQVGDRKFQAGPFYKALIPVEDQNHPGLVWLDEHGAGDLIKNVITVTFPKGSDDEARLAEQLIRQRFQMADVTRQRAVHHMTLTAWLKEMHQSTNPNKVMPPLDVIGGIIGRIVKISKAKGVV